MENGISYPKNLAAKLKNGFLSGPVAFLGTGSVNPFTNPLGGPRPIWVRIPEMSQEIRILMLQTIAGS